MSSHAAKRRKNYRTGREISSGAVVYKVLDGVIMVALVRVKDARGRDVWTLPKGLKEPGENLARTAHREVKEETGLDGRIKKNLGEIHYFYTRKERGRLTRYFKLVYFFLMEYTGGETSEHDEEVIECGWMPSGDAISAAKYPDERDILKKAVSEIESLLGRR